MALILEIVKADGSVTRVSPEAGLARVPAEPGSTYRLLTDDNQYVGPGARVLRYENDLVVVDLPGEANFEVANFFSVCDAQQPCQFSLQELGGAPGEVITPMTSPVAALPEGGFLMSKPGDSAAYTPPPPESDFNWKPVAAIGGGLLVAAAGLGGGGGGGGADATPPGPPTLKTTIVGGGTPLLEGTAEPGSTVTLTINPGNAGQVVTYTTTANANGIWQVDLATATPSAGSLPAGGLPAATPSPIDLVARDVAGNLSTVTSQSITIDITPPPAVASITTLTDDVAPVTGSLTAGSTTNDGTPTIVGTISEPLEAGDRVQVLRDGVVLGQATVSGLSWTYTDNTAPADGLASYTARVADAAGNTSATTAPFAVTIDTVVPVTPTINQIDANNSINKPEATAGVLVSGTAEAGSTVNITWADAVARSVVAAPTGAWSTTYALAELPTDGPAQTLSVVAVDAAGNVSPPATQTLAVDRADPTLAIVSSVPTVTNGAVTLSLNFSEPVIGFNFGDIVVTGAASAGGFDTISPSQYSLVLTPAPGTSASTTVSVAANAAQDAAGNASVAASLIQAFDTIVPTLTITDNIPQPTATGPVTFTFDFGETVTGFTNGDLLLSGGTATPLVSNGPGSVYTTVVTPTPNSSGTISIGIAANTVADPAGNQVAAASATQAYNTSAPTVTITNDVSVGAPPPNGPITYTFTFSEPVTGFGTPASDIVVTNGTAAAPVGSGAVYTAVITPTAGVEGSLGVSVPANAATDGLLGNTAGAAAPQLIDTARPTVSIADDTPGTANSLAPVTYSFTFSEAVTGFTAADITVTGGTKGTFIGSGASYSLEVTPTAATQSGTLQVSVAAGGATDLSGNTNTASTVSTQPFDTSPPTLDIIDDKPDETTDTVTFTFTFSEPIINFDISDITIPPQPNLTWSSTFLALGPDSFSLTINGTATTPTLLTLNLNNSNATDNAGNPIPISATASQLFTASGGADGGLLLADSQTLSGLSSFGLI